MRINAPQIIIHLLSRCHILQLQIFFWTANLLHLQESNASKWFEMSFVLLTAMGSCISLIRDVAGKHTADSTPQSMEDEWISIWKC